MQKVKQSKEKGVVEMISHIAYGSNQALFMIGVLQARRDPFTCRQLAFSRDVNLCTQSACVLSPPCLAE